MYRKHHNNKLNGDGPPKYKPPPPTKKTNTNTSTDRLNVAHNPASEGRPLQSEDYAANQSAEPVTDLDNYTENDDGYGPEDEREHYYSAAPPGWDDPAHSEILPPYAAEGPQEDQGPGGTSVNREDSFVSPAMYV